MPAQNRFGLDDDERVLPKFQSAGKAQKPETVGGSELGRLGVALQDGQVGVHEGILEHEFEFGTREVLEGTNPKRRLVRD